MTFADKLLILSLVGFSAYSIPLTVLHLSLAFLPRDAKMLTACQSLRKRKKGDSIPKQEEDGNASTLRFFNIGIGL